MTVNASSTVLLLAWKIWPVTTTESSYRVAAWGSNKSWVRKFSRARRCRSNEWRDLEANSSLIFSWTVGQCTCAMNDWMWESQQMSCKWAKISKNKNQESDRKEYNTKHLSEVLTDETRIQIHTKRSWTRLSRRFVGSEGRNRSFLQELHPDREPATTPIHQVSRVTPVIRPKGGTAQTDLVWSSFGGSSNILTGCFTSNVNVRSYLADQSQSPTSHQQSRPCRGTCHPLLTNTLRGHVSRTHYWNYLALRLEGLIFDRSFHISYCVLDLHTKDLAQTCVGLTPAYFAK